MKRGKHEEGDQRSCSRPFRAASCRENVFHDLKHILHRPMPPQAHRALKISTSIQSEKRAVLIGQRCLLRAEDGDDAPNYSCSCFRMAGVAVQFDAYFDLGSRCNSFDHV